MGALTVRAGPADLIVHNGLILTMDAAGTIASALAVRDGTIQAAGSDTEVLGAAGRHTRLIDLGGRTVVPGLIDAHTHVELTSYSRHFWHDVRGLSEPEILERVAELTAAAPPGEWVVLQGTFGQRLPDRATLDQASPASPVAVRWSMHKFQLNTAALAAAGIDRATVPGPGIRIHHDSAGRPTGLIEEGWDMLGLPPPPAEKLAEAMAETTSELFLRHGITTISEITASTSGLTALQHLDQGPRVLPSFGLALTAAPGHQALIRTADFATSACAPGSAVPACPCARSRFSRTAAGTAR